MKSFLSSQNTDRKRYKSGKASDVEEALTRWFIRAKDMKIPITSEILLKKANDFALELKIESFEATAR